MNLPNKITMFRLFLAACLIILLAFPWGQVGVNFPTYLIFNKIVIDLKYIIGGVIFVIAAISDFVDGNIARKRNLVTDFGKIMDAIADKILVNPTLIILAYNHFIPVIVPVIIISRDIITDSIKMSSGNKGKVVGASNLGKLKTIFMMVGLALVFFYNLPFELLGIRIADILILLATVLSVISGVQYYLINKDVVFTEK